MTTTSSLRLARRKTKQHRAQLLARVCGIGPGFPRYVISHPPSIHALAHTLPISTQPYPVENKHSFNQRNAILIMKPHTGRRRPRQSQRSLPRWRQFGLSYQQRRKTCHCHRNFRNTNPRARSHRRGSRWDEESSRGARLPTDSARANDDWGGGGDWSCGDGDEDYSDAVKEGDGACEGGGDYDT